MKILEIVPYSAGICGVWARAKEEATRLSSAGHTVRVFSSNFEKGTGKRVALKDKLGPIEIHRFVATKLGGESFMHFNFLKEGLMFSPDVIIAHNYRHLHTTKALRLARMLRKQGKKVKVFLVTHAPFVEGNITRSAIASAIVGGYDKMVGPRTLPEFDQILTISRWELPHLLNSGAHKDKITYIPNGIPEEFFSKQKSKATRKILFLGRIAPKKKLETLLEAIPYLNDKKIKVEIVGPSEKEYFAKLSGIIKKLDIADRVIISKPIFDVKKKIAKIDSCLIYVLPSRVEGMPQSLIEAMARKKIVIGSDSEAIRDLIIDGKNGYLFEFDNAGDLARAINEALKSDGKKVTTSAYELASHFNWKNVIKELKKAIS